MFLLKKIIAALLMPLSVALVFLWAGWWLTRKTSVSSWGRSYLFLGVLGLTLASNKGVGVLLLRGLEGQYPPQPAWTAGEPPPASLQACTAVLVLGGGHAGPKDLPPNSRLSASALARIVEGCRIAQALPNAQLWTSGPYLSAQEESHAEVLAAVAVQLGVSRDRLRLIESGHDTEGEAAAVRLMVTNDTRVALVTSAWHMPRAVGLFKRAGVDVVPCPTDYAVRLNPQAGFWDYAGCDLTGLERTQRAVYEYLGLTWAKLRGKL